MDGFEDRLRESAGAEAIAAAVAENVGDDVVGGHHGGGPGAVSVRTVQHGGREIVIRTVYEITVDGEPFDPHVVVDNAGRVHYHGLPTRDFASMVDLVSKAVDAFPDEFGPGAGGGHGGHGGHGHGGAGESGGTGHESHGTGHEGHGTGHDGHGEHSGGHEGHAGHGDADASQGAQR